MSPHLFHSTYQVSSFGCSLFLFIYQSGGVYVNGIEVIHYPFETDRIKGLYCDGTIAISTDMKTDAEKACVLAEELGHHYTTYGNILDQSV